MGYIKVIGNYKDNNGNVVESPDTLQEVYVAFAGKNNKLIIDKNSKLMKTKIHFPNDGGVL